MKLETMIEQTDRAGDFYLHFRRQDGKGQTYLVGTRELLGNPYIYKRMEDKKDPCGLPFSVLKRITSSTENAFRAKALEKLAKEAEAKGNVLVFSWSSDRFRVIPLTSIIKVHPLSNVLRNGN